MPSKRRQKPGAAELLYAERYRIALVSILLFGFCLNLLYFYGPSWINGTDSYSYLTQAEYLAHGHYYYGCETVDCVNYLLIAGLAAFIYVFGYGMFAVSLFGITCYLLTILVLYLMGRELHSRAAGLLAGFFYSIFPLVLSQSSNVGDMVPMAFLFSLSMYVFILAVKGKKVKPAYLLAAGFLSMINFLNVSEAIIGVFIISSALLALTILDRKKYGIASLGYYIAGAAAAAVIILLIGVLSGHGPLFVFTVYAQNYAQFNVRPAFSTYIYNIFRIRSTDPLGNIAFGYLGYAFLLSSIYLVYRGFRKGALIWYWFAFSLLYLGYGTMSLTHYEPVLYDGPRFFLIAAPAMALIIGIGLAELIRSAARPGMSYRVAVSAFIAAAIIALVWTSMSAIAYIGYSQLAGTEPLIQIGNYINGLPSNAVIYGPNDVPWQFYLNGTHTYLSEWYSSQQGTCSGLMNTFKLQEGAYVVGNITDSSACGLTKVYSPTPVQWLQGYNLFSDWGTNFSDFNVYEYNGTGQA